MELDRDARAAWLNGQKYAAARNEYHRSDSQRRLFDAIMQANFLDGEAILTG